MVAVAFYGDGTEIVAAYNAEALETTGLSRGALDAARERQLPDLRRLEDGEVSTPVKAELLEPFFTTKPGGKGTGLGLSVSFGIIQDHGGEVSLGDAPEGGAEFRITLPVFNDAASGIPGT